VSTPHRQLQIGSRETLRLAQAHYAAGRFTEAIHCAEALLRAEPTNAAASHLCGIACLSANRHPEAVRHLELAARLRPTDAAIQLGLGVALQTAGRAQDAITAYNRSVELKPGQVEVWCRLASAHQQLQQLDQATTAYRRALALSPEFSEAACNLGGILIELGRTPEAIEAFQRALIHKPQFPEAQNGLGIALKNANQQAEAIVAFQQALALRPLYADAWFNLGNALQALERWPEAIDAYRKAQEIGAASPDVLNNLGLALWNAREFAAAAAAHEKALALKPDFAEVHNNLGNDFLALGRYDEAAAAFERAATFRPGYREALCNLGNVFVAQNRTDEAIAAYRRAAADTPFPDAEYNEALALLLKGDFTQGLPKYESRWASKSSGLQRRGFTQPRWQGEDIRGRTLLLYSEQGLGDTLQFIRYVPLVARRGAKIVLRVQPPLKTLLASLPNVECVQTSQDELPPFDFHCSLLSLPLIFGTEPGTIPATVPYIETQPAKVGAWRERLAASQRPRIGVVCSGNPKHKNDHNRSIPLSAFAPLAALLGGPLHVVQKELKPADLDTIAHRTEFIDLSGQLADFGDTAAVIANLDLIISVDTSVVHLAGALGKPVWTLLPFAPDWRWLLDRADSPWYPTMRLFRQPTPGDWSSVLRRVTSSLQTWKPA
jgi:tetratricopeptide (TPR) repeat protein